MIEQLYILHVDQWPAAVDATVRIVNVCAGDPGIVTVEGVEPRYPFVAGGKGLPIMSSDVEWYPQKVVYRNRLTALQPAAEPEADVTELRARFATLEASLDEPMPKERADQVMLELVDLQAAIEKADGKMDEWADGRMMLRGGHL